MIAIDPSAGAEIRKVRPAVVISMELLGAVVLPLLQQICVYSSSIGNQLEYTVIGAALLLGTVANELLMRRSAARRG